MVTETGLAPANEPNPWILSILFPREATLALPNDSDEERLQCLISSLRRVSTTQRRSISQEQIQLQEQDEINEIASDSGAYIESVIDYHDYEFLSNNDSSPQAIDMTYDKQPPIDDDIAYEDIPGHPNLVKHVQNNQVCDRTSKYFLQKNFGRLVKLVYLLLNWVSIVPFMT